MRIIAGDLKGMSLTSKVSYSTRPTSDAVRETIFNLLQTRFEIVGAMVADLFAGTGALGIECISRGAIHCDFVDLDRQARKAIRENVEKATAHSNKNAFSFTISKLSVDDFVEDVKNLHKYDVVFADPPYLDELELDLINVIKSQGLLVYETSASKLDHVKLAIENDPRILDIETYRKIGKTGVVVARVA